MPSPAYLGDLANRYACRSGFPPLTLSGRAWADAGATDSAVLAPVQYSPRAMMSRHRHLKNLAFRNHAISSFYDP